MNRRIDDRRTPRDNMSHGAVGALTRVCVIVGTRPEVIKMAPVIHRLRSKPAVFETVIVTTAQHREMLAQAMETFDIVPHVDLALMSTRQALADFTSRALLALSSCLTELKPDVVLVQGDTTTVMAASLAAHYLGIPIGHVEAGLRSGNLRNPFPEELNRRLASAVADLHFAPTEQAKENLLREGISAEQILVTGNTIVDALQRIPRRERFATEALNTIPWNEPVVLTTVHRRENIGEPLRQICAAMCDLTQRFPRLHLLFPVHLNPHVRDIVIDELSGNDRIVLVDPLPYADLLEAIRRSRFVMTDSGGIQEECPSLRTPVLVLRKNTERPEVVTSGFGRVVGTEQAAIVAAAGRLLSDEDARLAMTSGENPFGDGHAAERIVDMLEQRMVRRRPPTPRSGIRAVGELPSS
ncbi:MAG: UDP-N-acetylglucosamine 2-epimerase (non-hydrolyzing) [Gemmatimonadaceae bacterium]